jgi:inner membrane protein
MKNLKNSVIFKVAVIIVMILFLMIPAMIVRNLIDERENVQRSAIQEVSSRWGNGQTLTGPYISIPYDKYVKQYEKGDSADQIVKMKDWIYFLPQELRIDGKLNPEKRYRGIYEVVVYGSEFTIEGFFNSIDLKKFEIDLNNIHFDKATLNLGISDLKGIQKQVELNWNAKPVSFNSGTSSSDVVEAGINAPIEIGTDSMIYHFSMTIDLKGSQNLFFIPVGKTTDVSLNSPWQTPSFTGNYLPDQREITAEGFESHWNILHLNRNYPQSWTGSAYSVGQSSFGLELLLPVDNFKKSYRVARYAILFLVFTFMVFFFVEVLNRVYIHPVQYLLVGISLIVFYVLLLSVSEHIKFNYAYIIASLSTLLLITAYTTSILKSRKVGLLMFSILFILYTFIFILIQLEDYALLIGSIGLFIILSIVMYFSRKIDWYDLKIGES